MPYSLELNINGLGYIIPTAWNSNDQSAFLVEDYQGNPTTVSAAVGAQIVAGSRAWTLLQTLFGADNLEAASVNWDTVVQQGGIVNGLNVLNNALPDILGDAIAVYINPATIIDAAGDLTSQITDATVKTIDLTEASFGVELAQRILQQSYSTYQAISYQVSNHLAVNYTDLANCINQAICAMSLGQSMTSMITQIEGFSETWAQSLEQYAVSVANAVSSTINPLISASLTIESYTSTLSDSTSDYERIADSISEAAQLSVAGYSPMTGSGLANIESGINGLSFVHDGSTQPVPATSPGAPANPLPPESLPADAYGHSPTDAYAITANPIYQGVLDQLGTNDWFSVYLIGGEAYRFVVDGAPVDGLTALADPHLYIVQSDKTTEVGDAPAIDGTAVFSLTAPSSGVYYLQVSSDVPNTVGGYALTYSDAGPSEAPPPALPSSPPPSLTLTTDDYEVSEGQAFHFELETSTPITSPVTIQWAVEGTGTHPAIASDFQATSGTLTLNPNQISQYGFNVITTNNGDDEYDQDFQIGVTILSGNASVSAGDIDCVILNSNTGAIAPTVEPPNLDLADATLMQVNSYSNGYIVSSRDVDYYKFYLTAGATYQIAAFGTSQLQSWSSAPTSTGYQALLYPEATLFDASGNVITQTLPKLSGVPSEVSEMFTPGSSGYYYLGVATQYQDGLHDGEFAVLTSLSVPADDYANNTSTTGAIQVGGTTAGDIERNGDSDWFRVTLDAGQTYDAYALGTGGGASGNNYYWQNLLPLSVAIYDSQGDEVASSVFPSGAVTQNISQFSPTQTGTYYVSVAGTNSFTTGSYIAGVTQQAPDPSGITPVTLQPSTATNLESWANGPLGGSATNSGATQMFVGEYDGVAWGAALQFDLAGLPGYASAAFLEVYSPSVTGNYDGVVTGVPLKPWSQQSPLDADDNISFQGLLPVPDAPGWYIVDITTLYNEWQTGAVANYGVQLIASNAGSNAETFDSEANTNAALRPKLVVYGAPANVITVNPASNDVTGTAGPDDIVGSAGNDYISAGGGDDVIEGAPSDTIDGGTGSNTVTYSSSLAPVTVNLATNQDHGGSAEGDVLLNIEEVIGSSYDDQLTAGPTATSLYGGPGNDTLTGGAGDDYLDGGPGTDTAVFDVPYASATVTHNPDGSWTITTSTWGIDTLSGIERAQFLDRTVSLDPSTADADDLAGIVQSNLLIENTAGAVVVGELVAGQEQYSQIGALGPEWKFVGAEDFLDEGKSELLIQNTAGAVVVGDVVSGQIVYSEVAALGPEWQFVGSGDFLGLGGSQFLIENTSGAVVVGQVVGGLAQYSLVASLGSEWKFVGAGDYLGDSKDQFLIENTAGEVVVGEVSGTQTAYTGVAALGPEWKFVETGDFLGDGKSDFLIENTAGAVVVGEVTNGQAAYTTVGGLGPEWSFVGAGDYTGTGIDSFLIENTAGAIFTGTVVSGAAQYAQVGALGPEWTFHG